MLVNGLSHESTVSDFIPWWQPAMIAIDVLFGLVAVGGAVMFVLNEYGFGKKENSNG